MIRFIKLLLVSPLTVLPSLQAQVQPSAAQAIVLEPGWNLVSYQVGGPITPGFLQDSLQHPERLLEIWSYDSSGNPAVPGSWKIHRYGTLPPGFPNDLELLEPGRGYWIKIGTGRTTATLEGVPWDGSISIRKGWNLVGFPGLAMNAHEIRELTSVFGTAFAEIQQVWGHDAATNRFLGHDTTAVPQLRDLTDIAPAKGYWVYSISDTDLVLAASPFTALPADADAPPLQVAEPYAGSDPKYLGREIRYAANDGSDDAYDLNANGILDDPYTQDTVLFEISNDAIPITIGNHGNGSFNWVLQNHVPWLFTAPAEPRTWPDGATSRPRAASGTVSSAKASFILYADRTGMTPGRKSGESVTVWAGGVPHVIHVLLDVAEIDGDWRGSASTTRVGGRNISLGDVRLVINAFRPDDVESGGFRAVLNREQSILFPRDVYMEGIFFSSNQFKLTTNFEMPPGDRNAPPYSVFSPSSSDDPKLDARMDKDFNNDGKVDLMNPFPFGIRREITLIGTRVTPDRLEGSYIEAIRGMLPPVTAHNLDSELAQFVKTQFESTSQPIFIEGTFVLDRQSFEPSQRNTFSRSVQPEIAIGGSASTIALQFMEVSSPVRVQSVNLLIGIVFPDPSLLRLTLVSAEGTRQTLRDFGDSSPLPAVIEIPLAFRGELADGMWSLEVEWDPSSGERGQLDSWGLEIEGLSTQSVSGRVVEMSAEPIAGAGLRLDGFRTLTGVSAADGSFVFEGLTENDYTLTISKPGFKTYQETFFVGEQEVALGDRVLVPLEIDHPQIDVSPPHGFAPQAVGFQLLLPRSLAATSVTWDFGDGSAPMSGNLAELSTVTHIYSLPGTFTATVEVLDGASVVWGGPGASVPVTVLRRAADPSGAPMQCIATAFIGTMAARADHAADSPSASPLPESLPAFTTGHIDAAFASPMVSAIVYQESQWDSGTVDIDRSPRLAPATFSPDAEDSDFTGRTYIRYNASLGAYEALTAAQAGSAVLSHDIQSPGSYTTYTLPAGQTRPLRFRLFSAHGGYFLGSEPSTVGNIHIHPGRTLP